MTSDTAVVSGSRGVAPGKLHKHISFKIQLTQAIVNYFGQYHMRYSGTGCTFSLTCISDN